MRDYSAQSADSINDAELAVEKAQGHVTHAIGLSVRQGATADPDRAKLLTISDELEHAQKSLYELNNVPEGGGSDGGNA